MPINKTKYHWFQRYGWHGKNDELLQKTFDEAAGKYPFLEKWRDKSVTELEFLHGHLNTPGQMPAVICFRDKVRTRFLLQAQVDKVIIGHKTISTSLISRGTGIIPGRLYL